MELNANLNTFLVVFKLFLTSKHYWKRS